MSRPLAVIVTALVTLSSGVFAETTYMVRNIETRLTGFAPRSLVDVAGTFFFTAGDRAAGRELWRSDGTAAGTTRVIDLTPGPEDSTIVGPYEVGGHLVFLANVTSPGGAFVGDVSVCRVWTSNGTAGGTVAVASLGFACGAGFVGPSPAETLVVGGRLYVIDPLRRAMWVSDGTAEGTRVLITRPRALSELRAVGDMLFFSDGNVVLSSDGSSVMPVPGAYLTPRQLAAGEDRLFFTANTQALQELWKVDPEDDTATQVEGISRATALTTVGRLLFFTQPGAAGTLDLWRTDGTPESTVLLVPAAFALSRGLPTLAAVGPWLFFTRTDDDGGAEQWRSDGSVAGTVAVAGIRVGSDPSPTPVGGRILFVASDDDGGTELWRTDGTDAGTARVADVAPGPASSSPASLVERNGALWFVATHPDLDAQLWRSDGTGGGTLRVTTIGDADLGSEPSGLIDVAGTLFFAASEHHGGRELWKTDGTAEGTVQVADGNPGLDGSNPTHLTAVGPRLYFVATLPDTGAELWTSDGTPDGTRLLKDIYPGRIGSLPEKLRGAHGLLYFTATEPEAGRELWRSDGSPEGTFRVADIKPGPLGSTPVSVAEAGDVIVFAATDENNDIEPWRSDGTAQGTARVKDLAPGPTHYSSPGGFTSAGGLAYFSTNQGGVWVTDGTEGGTVQLVDRQHFDRNFEGTAASGAFYFVHDMLYRTDGTPGGTVVVVTDLPGGKPYGLTNVGGTLFFENDDGIWRSDATVAGTRRVDGPFNLLVDRLVDRDGTLFFVAAELGAEGSSLWRGVRGGTSVVRVAAFPGTLWQPDPDALTAIGSTVFFPAFQLDTGVELWASQAVCGDGETDADEQCDDGNTRAGDCCGPACRLEPSDTMCRAAAGACDLPELCSGTAGSCPADAKSEAVCRYKTGSCDVAERCDGTRNDCPPDAKSTAVCRAAAGTCDVEERCDGERDGCPPDGFQPAGMVCRETHRPCVEFRCTREGVCAATVPACLEGLRCVLQGRPASCLEPSPRPGVARIVQRIERTGRLVEAADRAGRRCRIGKQQRRSAAAARLLTGVERDLERSGDRLGGSCRQALEGVVAEARLRMGEIGGAGASCAPACSR